MGDNLQKNVFWQSITGIFNVSDTKNGNIYNGNTNVLGVNVNNRNENIYYNTTNGQKVNTNTTNINTKRNDNKLFANTIVDKPLPLSFEDFLKQVLKSSHIYILVWFIVIYLVVYIAFGYFLKQGGIQSMDIIMSRTFDLMIFIPLITFLWYEYQISSPDTKDHILLNIWEWSIEYMDNIMNLFGILLFTLCFYLMVYFLNIPMSQDKQPFAIYFLESKIWSFIAIFIILMFFKHILGIDLLEILNNMVLGFMNKKVSNPEIVQDNNPVIVHSEPVLTTKHDEVFNIGNNLYTYEDAQNICSIYGARLANYDEIEDSYNHGGEWCNYGWSDGQMVFFPTQKSTWDKLQKNPKTKNACGRPGINGGFIDNPYIRFGVNCYGKKPDPKESDKNRMNQPINVPKTQQEIEMEHKMRFWKENADKLLQINSFNNTNWSEF
jgi:hypothetical protein